MSPEYFEELCNAMSLLAADDYLFCGQAVEYDGTAMSTTLRDIPKKQLLEFPVMENSQLGFCTGIAIAGGKVCSIYPRINFMLEALPQLIQHLDKIPLFSDYRPKVIIRTAIATPIPLDAGVQHLNDYSAAIQMMLSTVKLAVLSTTESIIPAYQKALEDTVSTILVEDYRE